MNLKGSHAEVLEFIDLSALRFPLLCHQSRCSSYTNTIFSISPPHSSSFCKSLSIHNIIDIHVSEIAIAFPRVFLSLSRGSREFSSRKTYGALPPASTAARSVKHVARRIPMNLWLFSKSDSSPADMVSQITLSCGSLVYRYKDVGGCSPHTRRYISCRASRSLIFDTGSQGQWFSRSTQLSSVAVVLPVAE